MDLVEVAKRTQRRVVSIRSGVDDDTSLPVLDPKADRVQLKTTGTFLGRLFDPSRNIRLSKIGHRILRREYLSSLAESR